MGKEVTVQPRDHHNHNQCPKSQPICYHNHHQSIPSNQYDWVKVGNRNNGLKADWNELVAGNISFVAASLSYDHSNLRPLESSGPIEMDSVALEPEGSEPEGSEPEGSEPEGSLLEFTVEASGTARYDRRPGLVGREGSDRMS